MVKKNKEGRTAKKAAQGVGSNAGKMRGKILMGGSISIVGPSLIDELACKGHDSYHEADHVEFNLEIGKAEKFAFSELSPFFDLTEADIKILTEARDGNQICDSFTVEFRDGQGRILELILSVNQIRALAEIFEKYITAHDSWERLEKPFRVSL